MTTPDTRLALRAPPTPIRNRESLMQALASACQPGAGVAGPIAVLMFTLHDSAGADPCSDPSDEDGLAAVVGARLSRVFRADDCVSRLDHGLFGCLIAGMDDQQALNRLACRAQDAIGQTVSIGGQPCRPQLSIGVAVWPQDGDTMDDVLASAQAAMAYARLHQTGSVFVQADPASLATSRSTRSVTSEPTPRKPA